MNAAVTLADLAGDPHAALARLRVDAPVAWVEDVGGWLVTRRDLALQVMRDDESFTVDDARFTTARVVGPSMLSLDGERHARHRAPFARAVPPGRGARALHGRRCRRGRPADRRVRAARARGAAPRAGRADGRGDRHAGARPGRRRHRPRCCAGTTRSSTARPAWPQGREPTDDGRAGFAQLDRERSIGCSTAAGTTRCWPPRRATRPASPATRSCRTPPSSCSAASRRPRG